MARRKRRTTIQLLVVTVTLLGTSAGVIVPLLPHPAGAAPADLFFSEYIEGSSNSKAVEIYNGTGADIDLAAGGYALAFYSNGSASASTVIALTGSVASGDVYVVADDGADPAVLGQADQLSFSSFYNGDDAVVLRKNGAIIDVIGQIGYDPGSQWGNGSTSTQDNTLRRKAGIAAGDPNGSDFFDPAVEWDGFAQDTFDGLGWHSTPATPTPTSTGTDTPTPTSPATATSTETPTATATDTATPIPTETPTATATDTAIPTDTPTATPTDTPTPTPTPAIGAVVINEVVTDPQQDWSSSDFDGTVGSSTISDVDEFVELYIKMDGLDLSGWTIELIDGTTVTGDLTKDGAFQVSRYVGVGGFTNTVAGDYLVLGNVAGSGALNDKILIMLKDNAGAIIDEVELGNDPAGDGAGDEAPNGDASGTSDEAVARYPNGADSDDDTADFIKGAVTLGQSNNLLATPTPTPTFTPTFTPSPTPIPTATETATPIPTPTDTSTSTPTPSPTNTATPTETATPIPSPTATGTDTATPSPTGTATHTLTPLPTATGTATPTPTSSATPDLLPTDTPTATATNTPQAALPGVVVINEVVTDPQQDWSSSDFDGAVGSGSVSGGTDEFVELYIKMDGLDLSGWTIDLIDTTPVSGTLAALPGGAFQVSRYVGAGVFTNTSAGDYLVLGNVASTGAMNNSVHVALRDGWGTIIDQVELGGEAPDGNATDASNEAVLRYPNGADSDDGVADFIQGAVTLGQSNNLLATPTPTPSLTPTAIETATSSPANTATPTETAAPAATATGTAPPTSTSSATLVPLPTDTPTITPTNTPQAALPGVVVINEIVTDPQQDWSSSDFDGTPGSGSVSGGTDEFVELYIKMDGLDLSGWTIDLIDSSPVTGTLAALPGGAFQVSRYVGAGVFTNTAAGDYLVLGNVAGSGAMNNKIHLVLRDGLDTIIDQVELGDDPAGDGPGDEAPDGNAPDPSDEAVLRYPNGADSEDDAVDFIKGAVTLGQSNDSLIIPTPTATSIPPPAETPTPLPDQTATPAETVTTTPAGTPTPMASGTATATPDATGTATPTATPTNTPQAALPGVVVINEIVTDPQQDWSSSDFDGTVGSGSVSGGTDEFVELYIKMDGLDLSGWTIELIDSSPVSGTLTALPGGAFQVSRYIGAGTSVFTNTAAGDYLVLGNVAGSGAMNNSVDIVLRDGLGTIIDQVELGSEAPNGNATDASDEAVLRYPNGSDSDDDAADFIQGAVTLGQSNDALVIPTPTATPTVTSTPTPAPVLLISEFLYDGTAAGGEGDEFVEICNPNAEAVSLAGYKVGDEETAGGGESMYHLPPARVLQAGGCLVVAKSQAAFLDRFGALTAAFDDVVEAGDLEKYSGWGSGSWSLSNTGDELLLLGPQDQLLDSVAYRNGDYAGLGLSGEASAPQPDSLQRVWPVDTNSMTADFVRAAPNPGAVTAPPAPPPTPPPPAELSHGMRAYWGDLHAHTAYSDGAGPPFYALAMYRAAGFHFAAITDHGWWLDLAGWEETFRQSNAATVPGAFVALRGVEWSHATAGHINVFNSDTLLARTDPRFATLDDLYGWLAANPQALAQFNHPDAAYDGTFDDFRLDPAAVPSIPLQEIGNNAQQYTTYEAAWLQSNMAGWRVAPTNNSDIHTAAWGRDLPTRSGIVAPELTAEALLAAIQARRVFATEDQNLALSLRAGAVWMGSELDDNSGPLDLTIEAVDAEAEPLTLHLYDTNLRLATATFAGQTTTWQQTVEARPGHFFWVKAEQADGDLAYSAPLWISGRLEPEPLRLSELLPAPGDNDWDGNGVADRDDEWIELHNPLDRAVGLGGWRLEEESGYSYTFPPDSQIPAQGYHTIYYAQSGLGLNNGGDTVRLIHPNGTVIDSFSYDHSPGYDESWCLLESGASGWNWNEDCVPSPGDSNWGRPAPAPLEVSIYEAKRLTLNAWVEIEGAVTVPPGPFGARTMYVQDSSAGIKVYLPKEHRLAVQPGDRLRLTGYLRRYHEEFELRVSHRGDIDTRGAGDVPPPLPIATTSLLEPYEGRLVKLEGRAVRFKGRTLLWIDDGTGPAQVYIRTSTGIKKPFIEPGTVITLYGIASQYSDPANPSRDDYRLLPRFQSDLVLPLPDETTPRPPPDWPRLLPATGQ